MSRRPGFMARCCAGRAPGIPAVRCRGAEIAGHSIRSFLFARLIAEQEGAVPDAAYDEDLLFAACVLHDLALGRLGVGTARFEVEGADLAASVLTEHAACSAAAAPPYSMGAELLRQRRAEAAA